MSGIVDSEIDVDAPDGLVVRVWEAVNTERSLVRVLEAATEVLRPVVPFAGVAILSTEHAADRLLAAHITGHPSREGETAVDYLGRPEFVVRLDVPRRPIVSYDETADVWAVNGEAYACPDLLAKDVWYEHELHMAISGIRAYASLPLRVRDTLIGVAAFSRVVPEPFTPPQLSLLKAVGRALAVAVANALANEEIQRLRHHLQAENLELRALLGQAPWFDEIVGDSAALRRALEQVEQVAVTDATVLITGETGTGKELVARALHRRSPRGNGPMVKVNCAAIPESLIASELFGHERGAFTGAGERRRGRFEQAHGGTIFLDEIGELPPATQVSLLRVLQAREFERLGGSQTVRVDVRVIAATNRDLASDVATGRFRSDLYYRLNVFPVHVPALRDRPDDVTSLAAHFVQKYAGRLGRTITRIDTRSLTWLQTYTWPGNVRELENVIERAVILSKGPTLRLDRDIMPAAETPASLADHVNESERALIETTLSACRGRVSGAQGAARRLGLPASTLEFRIKRLGIDKFRHRR
jgi:formate hydrogenlyase transcriptional activator